MTLGLAPLSGLTGGGPAERALRLIYERGGRAFNFGGLRSFKAKWHPRWEPRYLGYRREADLPRIALAVARAGELQVPKPFDRFVSSILRIRGSAALLGVIWSLMIATTVRPGLHAVLLHRFGLRYQDLRDGQLWKLISAPLLQPRPGILWSNVAMLIAVPVAEIRLGWRRTLASCFLAALRIASVTSASAAAALNVANTGSSSLAWGAAAACAASLPTPRLRVIVAGVLTLPLLGALVLHQGIDDAQHLLAAAVGAGLILATGARTTKDSPLAWLRHHARRPGWSFRHPREKARTEEAIP